MNKCLPLHPSRKGESLDRVVIMRNHHYRCSNATSLQRGRQASLRSETTPRKTHDTLALLRARLASLSPSERRVGDYVLGNSEYVSRLTLAEIARQVGVSDASALRFCRTLGYDGWLEFKFALVQSLPRSPQLIVKDITAEDSTMTAARKAMLGSRQAIDDTMAVLDEAAFEQALSLLSQAAAVLIVAVGTSGPMAHEMFNRLFRLGIKAQVQTDSYLQVMQASLLTQRDVLVVISQTGDSADPRLTAMTARKNDVPTICITGSAVSPLVEHADVVLLSVSQESMAETLSSRIAQYALIHAIYVCLALRSLDQAMENEQMIWRAMMHKPARRDGSTPSGGEGEL